MLESFVNYSHDSCCSLDLFIRPHLECLPCQPDLILNLVHSAHPLVSTLVELSLMAGSTLSSTNRAPLPCARESPDLASGLGFALTWLRDPGTVLLLSGTVSLYVQSGNPPSSSKIAGLGKGISLGMMPLLSLPLSWQGSQLRPLPQLAGRGRGVFWSRASHPFEKYSSLCVGVGVWLPPAQG